MLLLISSIADCILSTFGLPVRYSVFLFTPIGVKYLLTIEGTRFFFILKHLKNFTSQFSFITSTSGIFVKFVTNSPSWLKSLSLMIAYSQLKFNSGIDIFILPAEAPFTTKNFTLLYSPGLN